eukprot:353863_1
MLQYWLQTPIIVFTYANQSQSNIMNHNPLYISRQTPTLQLCNQTMMQNNNTSFNSNVNDNDNRNQNTKNAFASSEESDSVDSYQRPKAYKKKGNLINHQRVHSNNCFKCRICSKKFTTNCTFQKHQSLHFREKPFNCHFCNKCFKKKNVLSDHIRSHTGEKPFQCNICWKSFSIKQNLKVHKRRVHGRKM